MQNHLLKANQSNVPFSSLRLVIVPQVHAYGITQQPVFYYYTRHFNIRSTYWRKKDSEKAEPSPYTLAVSLASGDNGLVIDH